MRAKLIAFLSRSVSMPIGAPLSKSDLASWNKGDVCTRDGFSKPSRFQSHSSQYSKRSCGYAVVTFATIITSAKPSMVTTGRTLPTSGWSAKRT
jgi:hypothetical protein